MSETPMIPVLDQKSEQINYNANERYRTSQVDQHFANWEHGFDTEERFVLERDEKLNDDLWSDTSVSTVEAPDYAEKPKAHEQEVSESLQTMSDIEKVHYALSISRALPTMRRLV